jgi:hypothetical protein
MESRRLRGGSADAANWKQPEGDSARTPDTPHGLTEGVALGPAGAYISYRTIMSLRRKSEFASIPTTMAGSTTLALSLLGLIQVPG